MRRTNRFVGGLASGYVTIAANIAYSIGSVPVALYYLSKEEFGLWVLIVQIAGYLSLLDLGMSVGIARFLADCKDDVNGGEYGSILKTGQGVFLIQAGLIGLLGVTLTFFAPALFNIPQELQRTFQYLLFFQCCLCAAGFLTKMAGAPLWCHQRYDVTNLSAAFSLLASFAGMWLGFTFGLKLFSLTLGAFVGQIVNFVAPAWACWCLKFYPQKGHWGHFNWNLFRQIGKFGSSMFLMSLGAQLATASQVIVISRLYGLEAASAWAICTKTYGLGQQVVNRFFDSSAGGLAEMLVKKEFGRMKVRFRDLTVLTGAFASVVAGLITLSNSLFVELWTGGKFEWSVVNNSLIAILLISTTVVRCHTGLVGITKEIRWMKYIYLAEGLLFLCLASILARFFGFSGILISSTLCNLLITGMYGVFRSARFFTLPAADITKWGARTACTALCCMALAYLLLPFLKLQHSWLALVGVSTVYCVAALPIFWMIGLPASLRTDIRTFSAGLYGRLLQRGR